MRGKPRKSDHLSRKRRKPLGNDAFDWGDDDHDDDVVDSNSSSGDEHDGPEEEEEDAETAATKRIRIAKEYLDNLQENTNEEENIATPFGVSDRIARQLDDDVKEAHGKLFRRVAIQLLDFEFDQNSCRFFRGHKLSTTATALSQDGKRAFSASKDGSILKWDLTTGRKSILSERDNQKNQVSEKRRCLLAIALSSDDQFLATGGRDQLLRIWNPETNELIETFSGHRDAISCLTFRENSTALFSGSHDRSIKHWNLTEMGYVETLFGHQSFINAVDSLHAERVFSCSNDKSVRMWKVAEETQLIFNGTQGSMDCLCMINEQYCVTGTDDGSLILFFNGKKKPVFTQHEAHGPSNWISSVAILRGTDLLASGSCDGFIRLWQVDLKNNSLSQVGTIPAIGFVNSMTFARNGRFLLAGLGQEHRLGRWTRIQRAKNGILLIALPQLSSS